MHWWPIEIDWLRELACIPYSMFEPESVTNLPILMIIRKNINEVGVVYKASPSTINRISQNYCDLVTYGIMLTEIILENTGIFVQTSHRVGCLKPIYYNL